MSCRTLLDSSEMFVVRALLELEDVHSRREDVSLPVKGCLCSMWVLVVGG